MYFCNDGAFLSIDRHDRVIWKVDKHGTVVVLIEYSNVDWYMCNPTIR